MTRDKRAVRELCELDALTMTLAASGWEPTAEQQAELDARHERILQLGPISPAVWAEVERRAAAMDKAAAPSPTTPEGLRKRAQAVHAAAQVFVARWRPAGRTVTLAQPVTSGPVVTAPPTRPRERSPTRASPGRQADDDPDPPDLAHRPRP